MTCVAGRLFHMRRINMKKTFSMVTGVMLALMMLFVSCEQGGVSNAQIDSRDLVSVSFTKLEAKSVNVDNIGTVTTPELASLYFQYKAVKNSADTSDVTIGAKTEWTDLGAGAGLEQTIQLSRGKWDISLRGFASASNRASGTNAIFEGALTQDIGSNLASRNEAVNVALDFTNPEGTGAYSLAVSIPASYASQAAQVKVTVTPASGDAQTITKSYSADVTSNTFSFNGLGNGIASVKVEYMDNAGVAIGDSVNANTLIMTDMTTNGNAVIGEDNTFTVSFAGAAINGTAENMKMKLETPILSSVGTISKSFHIDNYDSNNTYMKKSQRGNVSATDSSWDSIEWEEAIYKEEFQVRPPYYFAGSGDITILVKAEREGFKSSDIAYLYIEAAEDA